MTERYYFTTLSAANGFADQSNSLHTSFYFTARWPLYCSATAVGERRQEKVLPLLSQRIIKQTLEQEKVYSHSHTELTSVATRRPCFTVTLRLI